MVLYSSLTSLTWFYVRVASFTGRFRTLFTGSKDRRIHDAIRLLTDRGTIKEDGT